ncbi:hypothetical protein PPL_06260 [Heterostelium album PN500]|uniref:Uncharacterized protein n=1 Tax=Heterostelium pallidum (strain ATCC 26659 / Pp 5 / PN500) TaxID=670386 RepID=D3BCN4_HETP5|nr:hypothetical protein PPL_06260 [Heterostelium album PN500]EFA80676.1 hypothetical protein PPL_06260 [Heterostelium album PN500]|eukprot:XP_020432796.1 hypothetical protein PPL_06260 [Heterostelium album PN500]
MQIYQSNQQQEEIDRLKKERDDFERRLIDLERYVQEKQIEDRIKQNNVNNSFNIDHISLSILVHLEGFGDIHSSNSEGGFIGTRGQSRRLEGFDIHLLNVPNNNLLTIEYMAHLEGIGDICWQKGGFIGTRGQSRRLEGFAIRLNGPLSEKLGIRYKGHLQDIGDTPFYSDGQFCGTRGQSRRCEGIDMVDPLYVL